MLSPIKPVNNKVEAIPGSNYTPYITQLQLVNARNEYNNWMNEDSTARNNLMDMVSKAIAIALYRNMFYIQGNEVSISYKNKDYITYTITLASILEYLNNPFNIIYANPNCEHHYAKTMENNSYISIAFEAALSELHLKDVGFLIGNREYNSVGELTCADVMFSLLVTDPQT